MLNPPDGISVHLILSPFSMFMSPVIVPPANGKNGPPAPPPLETVIFPEASDTQVPAVYVGS